MLNRRQWLTLMAAAAATASAPAVLAQSRPTRLLVGATPGGGTDLVARTLAMTMEKPLASTIVVENRPGAAGNIAASSVAAARGDSSSLLLAYTSHAINPSMMKNLPFDPMADFTPISLVASSPLLLVANGQLPVTDLPTLLEYAERSGRQLSIGIAGLGSANQLAAELLQYRTGMRAVSVPYKGAAPAMQDLLGGQIDLMISNLTTVRAFTATGQLKPLAVTTEQSIPEYPGVRPVADVVPDFQFSSWYGLLGPAGLDAAAAATLETAARQAAASPVLRERLAHEGLRPVGSTGAEFRDFLQSEMARFAQVVKLTGISMG
ncbi:tripartite tricarboxylate transporter substrate binding protein [Verticiella sediminum]|uniref:Tripartite tricarboxylate transporter substrate binding protein n=1 Tax=Verticiella sediminum TaxID=1247510 RepID=A0A556AB09_9BURK|nr:tripartite tricarboxylate transporter substrate-binding protein [Verticiella sediminum]TSH90070.1 tripartite tricarboxylate transporter substrate binding protein [Verticiella sediminum]